MPEKLMFNVLTQLKKDNQINDFIYQLSKKHFSWCNKYKYDFYFKKDGKEYIIETNGSQHYKNGFIDKYEKSKRTIDKIVKEDYIKKELALTNNVVIIELDCSQLNINFIKNKIIESKLNSIFNLNVINWDKVYNFIYSSLLVDVCTYYNNNKNSTFTDISKKFNISNVTVSRYINKGIEIGLCK